MKAIAIAALAAAAVLGCRSATPAEEELPEPLVPEAPAPVPYPGAWPWYIERIPVAEEWPGHGDEPEMPRRRQEPPPVPYDDGGGTTGGTPGIGTGGGTGGSGPSGGPTVDLEAMVDEAWEYCNFQIANGFPDADRSIGEPCGCSVSTDGTPTIMYRMLPNPEFRPPGETLSVTCRRP